MSFKHTIKIDNNLLVTSIPASRVLGGRALNPCVICRCAPPSHRIRSGEVICIVHQISCTLESGDRIREHRAKNHKERERRAS